MKRKTKVKWKRRGARKGKGSSYQWKNEAGMRTMRRIARGTAWAPIAERSTRKKRMDVGIRM